MKPKRLLQFTCAFSSIILFCGCAHTKITAINLGDTNDVRHAIPYYLPKAYLFVSKNIRYIPAPTVGLTQTALIPNAFDSGQPAPAKPGSSETTKPSGKPPAKSNTGQSKQTSGNSANSGNEANNSGAEDPPQASAGNEQVDPTPESKIDAKPTTAPAGSKDTNSAPQEAAGPVTNQQVFGPPSIMVVPPGSIPDGLLPETFYTYQIVYLPDLKQKYGLKIKAGVGEMRSTFNLVNGWMFTGPGPLYLKDSSTSQNTAAAGEAVSSVFQSAANLATSIYGGPAGAVAKTTAGAIKAQAAPIPTRAVFSGILTNYAELWVYEIRLTSDGNLEFHPVSTNLPFISVNRDMVEMQRSTPTAETLGDRYPHITVPVNTLLASAAKTNQSLSGVRVIRTEATGEEFTVYINKTISDDVKQTILSLPGFRDRRITDIKTETGKQEN